MSARLLHLTKIEIDHETAFKAGLKDAYAWHQAIWKAFPGKDGQARDFLTRLDEIDDGLRLLLLSSDTPVRPDWCPESSWHSKAVDESFFAHTRYRFSLVANPTRKVKSAANVKNGKRVPVVHREDQIVDGKTIPGLLTWLARKGTQHGFQFQPKAVRTAPRPRQWFLKKGHAGLHSAIEFSGTLTVTNPALFQEAAQRGIGSAKAFGFGMLCLVPITND
ncbi:MAG: type I-E CRISPR-associated protein Cas6/Cse3/CasE [Terrimicrobiaceae bacterium]